MTATERIFVDAWLRELDWTWPRRQALLAEVDLLLIKAEAEEAAREEAYRAHHRVHRQVRQGVPPRNYRPLWVIAFAVLGLAWFEIVKWLLNIH